MIVGIHHIAISVSDIDIAFKFYTEGLGFELVQQADLVDDSNANRVIGLDGVDAKMRMLKAPNAFIELWQYKNPEPRDLRSRPCDYGYPHIALQVDDIDAEYARLKNHGMEFVGEPVHYGDTGAAIYGRDPSGNIIELYEIKTDSVAQLQRPTI